MSEADLFPRERAAEPSPDVIQAISMWQPWASLWLTDSKIHETRGRSLAHRGWLLVHATKHFVRDFPKGEPIRVILESEFGGHWAMDLPTGALIDAVQVVGCHRSEDLMKRWCDGGGVKIAHWDDYQCGDYAPGRFGIERAPIVKKFAKPIPYRGVQRWPFPVPADVVREAMAA